jgi:Putative transposase/Resolvase, N terminal domain
LEIAMTTPVRAALYLRVSTRRQADNDLSIPDQRRQAKAYCLSRGWEIVADYVEPGLSRYTHRVAISNRRLVAADNEAIAFRWKDYRVDGPNRWKTMRLHPHEFIRRFLTHVLPKGFHRIRHYGLFASTNRAQSIATARALLNVVPPAAKPQQQSDVASDTTRVLPYPCPCCGARMIVIETFAPGCQPSWRPTLNRIDTS